VQCPSLAGGFANGGVPASATEVGLGDVVVRAVGADQGSVVMRTVSAIAATRCRARVLIVTRTA
jgi:hypothetical protein